ncbi:Gfo/Idh/MocA family oxidoreductase [Plantactinospora sp. B6F1]|uniref:Gfo/Idh/MocA family protein n=1 Tax=Plantactinospora sp. B6F1 TaxID=3158971 RepID=UPI0032D8D5C8
MSPRAITVGVIGCGEIAQIMHLPHLRELDERLHLVAVCDTDPDVLKTVAQRFAVDRVATDATALLGDPGVDAVVIATPGDHVDLVQRAVAAGKHVLVEKPLCYRVEDAERIADRAESAGVTVMVGYSRLFDTAYDRFRDLAAEQPPGRLIRATAVLPDDYFFRAHHVVARCAAPAADSTTRAEPTWTYFFEEVLHNLATHELYCLRGLFRAGYRLTAARALLGRYGVHALWETDDGDAASLTLAVMTGLSGGYREDFLVAGPTAHTTLEYPSVYLKNTPATVRHTYSASARGPLASLVEEGAYADPFKRELEHFADVVTKGVACRSDARDAVHDVRAITDIFTRCQRA